MRIAIFVAVVVAHIALVWYFLTLWHLAASKEDDEPSMTLVFLAPTKLAPGPAAISEPEEPAKALSQNPGRIPLLYRNEDASSARELALYGRARPAPPQLRRPNSPGSASPSLPATPSKSATQPEPATSSASVPAAQPPTPPDWRETARAVTQADAQHIVESEDRAARQAGALTAMIKPLPGLHIPGPAFHWDPSPRYRWQPAPGGGFVIPLNDHCEVFVFIVVWAGCSIGELPPARGDLFKNMHPPVKFGDWDWRVDDP